MLPKRYRWLEAEPGPRMIVEALKEYGLAEKPGRENNPRILGWQRELQAAGLGGAYGGFYAADAIPWCCGLFMAVVAHRANPERRVERHPPKLYLSALEWARWGTPVDKAKACLGDVLVFKRTGGGHVGLYVGHDDLGFHVLGGNQSNRVSIPRIARSRLHAARRPAYCVAPSISARSASRYWRASHQRSVIPISLARRRGQNLRKENTDGLYPSTAWRNAGPGRDL